MKSAGHRAKPAKAGALFLSGIALAVAVPPAAADYGVGATHDGTGTTVMLPIRMDALTVEPEVRYDRSKQNVTTSPSGATSDTTNTSYGLATGIYSRRALGSSFEAYFGGRVGLDAFRLEQTSGATTVTQKSNSWFLGPTAGLQYYFSKQFSISLELGLLYERGKQKLTISTTEQTLTTKDVDTRTRVLLRGYF